MSTSTPPAASQLPAHSSSEAEYGATGPNGNDALSPEPPVTCNLDQALALSAPTPARLSDILQCWLQDKDTDYVPPPLDAYYFVEEYRFGQAYGEYEWEILDPMFKQWTFVNNEGRRERLRGLVQQRWPTSFGHLEHHSDGTPSGFRWDNTYPELLLAAFYPPTPEGQPTRRVIFQGPTGTTPPRSPGTTFTQSTPAPETPRTLNVEPAAHGKIWVVAIPSRTSPDEKRLSAKMPYSVLAFLANYCQTVGAFEPFQDGDSDGQSGGNHPYALGFRFAKAFINCQTSCHLELRTAAPPNVEAGRGIEPREVVVQYHARYLAAHRYSYEDREQGAPIRSGIRVSRPRARIRHTWGPDRPMIVRCCSLSFSILNTVDAPYTIVLLMDDNTHPSWGKQSQAWRHDRKTNALLFPQASDDELNGLRPCGRFIGLSHFLLMALTMFERWEAEWMFALDQINDTVSFSLLDTLEDERLDLFMFDESFRLSRAYFATLQTLRVASQTIDDDIKEWSHLRERWSDIVVSSGMFNSEELAASANNWNVVSARIETRANRVRAAIARKSEEVTSLRDGLFNATSLRESTKGMALNRAVYVFTVVTVLYTPIGFLTSFWAMPVLDDGGADSDKSGGRYSLPTGFLASFIAVPLLTYLICIAVVWVLGSDNVDRRLEMLWPFPRYLRYIRYHLGRLVGRRR
ncbi:uncharacterized protein B0H64DRAFT_411153 [Chaetomium fimeti]|uniref:Uncharacterized protein n=1 Tax=Chaetomium fimeti TaxID=1854472 RepID=A0AAE0LMW7_9PEZI|nr:hypothetical protein B0H64DRAFT_411153 [Chaetomium fimeti]